jgi:hypothetical protein
MFKKSITHSVMFTLVFFGLALSPAVQAEAQVLTAKAKAFVGKANQCGGTAGAKIIVSMWTNALGLPDDGTSPNTGPGSSNGAARQGINISKNGPTENCSAAEVDIVGDIPFTLDEIGFDVRNGTWCSGGAPRFNVVSVVGQVTTTYFFGCAHGDQTAAGQDGAWTQVRFNGAGGPYPGAEGFVFGSTPVNTIQIVMDEGTTLGGLPLGPGLSVIDNIKINNTLLTDKNTKAVVP